MNEHTGKYMQQVYNDALSVLGKSTSSGNPMYNNGAESAPLLPPRPPHLEQVSSAVLFQNAFCFDILKLGLFMRVFVFDKVEAAAHGSWGYFSHR